MTEFQNCGACGDRKPYDEVHECWVIGKIHTQETILETCHVCFEPIHTTHWRCVDPDNVQPS